ncbi:MAG: potassium-transporting ATPase subunit KdpC [Thermodesulfobacteriota bacterium]
MDNTIEKTDFFSQAVTSVRIVFVTMAMCCFFYPLVILGLGQTLRPHAANGSLVYNDKGEIVGSELIAQEFSRPGYFWPRPSAVDYNAAAAGGSNWSPTNPAIRDRAMARLDRLGVVPGRPVPADLVAASGSGLDPHITLAAAMYQAERVASARGLSVETVTALLGKQARRPGGMLFPQPLVNVLLVNMALDGMDK